jgi:Leucine-rich repeat (LRR) protein
LIKAPSDKLFAFNQIALNFAFDSIRPDAKFLFSKLARFTLLDRSAMSKEDPIYPSCSLIGIFKEFKSLTNLTTAAEDEHFEQLFRDLLCYKVEKATSNTNGTITTLSMLNEEFYDSSSWPDLKELSVFVDHSYEIRWNLFEKFPNLEKLDIRSDKFYNCYKYDLLVIFENGENLKTLNMKVNAIDCIQTLARCFPRLEELDLTGSRNMNYIGRNVFSNFPDLKKLSLSNCSIRKIDPDAFEHLLKLNELDISETIV